ncbi:MAG: SDR family oxidoreductase [Propionibacteriales bacterium]|nr:SDR family oxidoreductase [Propionibacteriales bacterium]
MTVPGRLAGRRTLVLGGGGAGIGRGICERFAGEGAVLAVADVDHGRAEATAEAIRRSGGAVIAISADVRDAQALDDMITRSADDLGGLDILITVIGGQVAFVPAVPLTEMADTDWDTMYELNLRYVARAVRRVLGIFTHQSGSGCIVSIGSVAGVMAAPHQAGYGVMKAGLLSLARTVAAEQAPYGTRMNVVVAGAISMAVANVDSSDEWVDEIPMGRLGSIADVANAALFLASDEAAYVTGQGLIVDGGVSVRGPFA